MILLAPIAAIIAASLAGPALLLVYVLKLRRRPLRVSSTLFWSESAQDFQANVPFRRLRISALFLLHLLLVAAFVLAIGRPVLRTSGAGAEAARTVYLIDSSASMSARDGTDGATRLDEAKRAVLRAIDDWSRNGGSADRAAAVISFASQPVALTGMTSSASALRDAVRQIEPTDQPGSLAPALALAEAIARGGSTGSESNTPARRATIVLFSDGVFRDESKAALAGSALMVRSFGDRSAQNTGERDNLGIVSIGAARRQADPAQVRLSVRVRNASTKPVAAPILVSLNGRPVERRVLEVPPDIRSATAGPMRDVSSPESAATFDFPSPEGGVAVAVIERADLLDADNSAAIVLAAPSRPRVLLVLPDARANPADANVSHELLADVLREWSGNVRVIRSSDATTLGAAATPGDVDLLVFAQRGDRTQPSLPAVPSITFGCAAADEGPTGRPPTEAGTTSDTFLLWNRNHPITRGLTLDGVLIAPSCPGGAAEAGKREMELARGRAGSLISLAEDGPVRRVDVRFDLERSNWALQVSFALFVAQAGEFLTGRADADAGRAFTTESPIRIRTQAAVERLRLDGPISVDAQQPEFTGDSVTVGPLARAGVYTIDSPAVLDHAVAVNLADATESSIDFLEAITLPGQAAIGEAGVEARELWPDLLLAGAVLLLIEWIVYAWAART